MNKVFIENLQENQNIDSLFLVQDKRVLETRNGKPYLRIRLQDKTGEIEGRVWEQANEHARHFKINDYVRVKGIVTQFQGELQVNISSIHKVPVEKVDPEDFLPVGKKDPDEMIRSLEKLIDSLKDADYKALLSAIFGDESFMKLFARSPAAKSMHHAWIGGLLEHTLSVARLAERIVKHYDREGLPLNRDLLITGAVLHDVGKTRELASMPSFEYTTEGKLIGHLIIGVEMIDKAAAGIPGFPEKKLQQIKHLVLSHHGDYAFGSPKLPMTLEAIALHFIDNLDAKLMGVYSHIRKHASEDSDWSPYHRIYGQMFYGAEIPELDNEEI
ncbi:MAG: HD family phosphohydrolase [Deltaproteobacteria bacterium]|nr:MAG: HD family phosphohydrolase [Deltaproteobacteria bacterium]